jgi:D-apiose dehydrogenase
MAKRFGIFGAGFWARFQAAAWRELAGAECVAICDPNAEKAATLAAEMGVPHTYTDPLAMFDNESLDFVDIVSAIESHEPLVLEAARRRIPVICQKPLADDLETSRRMVLACTESRTPLFVHENFRWQAPMMAAQKVIASGRLGRVIRMRLDFISGFPVFDNQPALKKLPRMILADAGVHILDLARFLGGEARSVYCRTQKVHREIAGEDVATVCLDMKDGATVVANLAYAGTPLQHESFPQTLLFVEGEQGSLTMKPDYDLRVTTSAGTESRQVAPTMYPWINPAYAVVQSSIVPCNESFLRTLNGQSLAETRATTGVDNYETLRLVFAAYESAKTGSVIRLEGDEAYGQLEHRR